MPRRKPEVHHESSDEAEEVNEEVEDADNAPIENSDEDDEDLEEHAEDDYKPMPVSVCPYAGIRPVRAGRHRRRRGHQGRP